MPRLTAQQIEQLLKMLPPASSSNSTGHTKDTDDEIDYSFAGIASFAGMAACLHTEQESINWVLHTGAIDHMTFLSHSL